MSRPAGGRDTGQNNGDLLGQTITIPGQTWTQSYGYDHLNRLTSAIENGGTSEWNQNYCSDAAGNRVVLLSSNYIPNSGITPQAPDPCTLPLPFTNNRWNGANHDNAGNLTAASGLGASYDAENRLLTANTAAYAYDGDGRRVSKTVGTTTTTYVYDAEGNLAAEYGGVSSSLCTTCYLVADALGSTRVVADGSGNLVRRYDYLPFGEALPAGIGGRTDVMKYQTSDTLALPDVVSQQFTGQQRDAEVGLGGLDFFEARYFSGAGGRFLSVDPENAGADSGNPQSWNGYAYALNNPFGYTDPTGMFAESGDPYISPQGYAQTIEPCINGYNPNTGNMCVTGTAQRPQAPTSSSGYEGLNFLEVMFLRSLSSTLPAVQPVAQVVETIGAWASAPRNPICTANYTAVGASIGFWAGGGLGTLGLAGGFAAAATIPGGAVGGAALGGGVGGLGALVMCSSGTWGGSGTGRGGPYRPKTRRANRSDAQKVADAARQVGVDRRAFGKFIERVKGQTSRGASQNFEYDELLQLAREFKAGAR